MERHAVTFFMRPHRQMHARSTIGNCIKKFSPFVVPPLGGMEVCRLKPVQRTVCERSCNFRSRVGLVARFVLVQQTGRQFRYNSAWFASEVTILLCLFIRRVCWSCLPSLAASRRIASLIFTGVAILSRWLVPPLHWFF